MEDLNDPDKRKKLIEEITKKYSLEYEAIIENYKKIGGKNNDEMWIFKKPKIIAKYCGR